MEVLNAVLPPSLGFMWMDLVYRKKVWDSISLGIVFETFINLANNRKVPSVHNDIISLEKSFYIVGDK